MQELSNLIHQMIQGNYPFFFFREPQSSDIKCGFINDSSIIKADIEQLKGKAGFIMAPFDENQEALFFPTEMLYSFHDSAQLLFQLTQKISLYTFKSAKEYDEIDDMSKEEYINMCNRYIEQIRQGKLQKAILSRIIHTDLCRLEQAGLIYKKLESEYPHAYVFIVYIPGKICWIGASPEKLLSFENKKFQTMALAGTMPFDPGITDKLENWGQKDIQEQDFVSQYIRECLNQCHIQNYIQSPVSIYPAGNVCHLQSLFQGTCGYEQGFTLLRHLHPTPAVCGLPKNEAIALINEVEKNDRSYYAGYLGYTNGYDSLNLYVNLRCASLREKDTLLYVGGGITGESDPNKEWDETCLKAQTLLNVIQQ